MDDGVDKIKRPVTFAMEDSGDDYADDPTFRDATGRRLETAEILAALNAVPGVEDVEAVLKILSLGIIRVGAREQAERIVAIFADRDALLRGQRDTAVAREERERESLSSAVTALMWCGQRAEYQPGGSDRAAWVTGPLKAITEAHTYLAGPASQDVQNLVAVMDAARAIAHWNSLPTGTMSDAETIAELQPLVTALCNAVRVFDGKDGKR